MLRRFSLARASRVLGWDLVGYERFGLYIGHSQSMHSNGLPTAAPVLLEMHLDESGMHWPKDGIQGRLTWWVVRSARAR
jgi:hypothetical protein